MMGDFENLLALGHIALTGARSPKEVGPILELIKQVEAQLPEGSKFSLLRASAVCSPLHLLAAVQGAWQALEEGSAGARDLGGETARYLAAERQVGAALKKAGLSPKDRELAVGLVLPKEAGTDEERAYPEGEEAVLERVFSSTSQAGEALANLIEALEWGRDDQLLSGKDFDYKAFGLEKEALANISKEKWAELVLSRCALVPLMK